MKINKLRLKNFIGIKNGLGLDEIEIDFSDVKGLCAFAGENGRGKSTVMENMTPYNTLASRPGALYQHVYTRNAEKELSFTYQGHEYRTLLKIDCQSGKSEGFIWKDGNSEVNGKITAYAKYITALLGSEAMFFASVFCAQNAAKLSDMTTGELKSLLSEFLNLEKLAGYEAESKEKITAVTGQCDQIDKQLLILKDKYAGYEDLMFSLAGAKKDLMECEASQETLKKKRVEYQAALELLRDKKSKQEVLLTQKANIEAKIKELEDTLAREQKDSDAELDALRDAYKSLQAQIKGNEDLIKQADEINAAAEKEKGIQEEIEAISNKTDRRNNDLANYQAQLSTETTELNIVQSGIKDIERDIDILSKKYELHEFEGAIINAKKQIAILAKRDQSCQSSTCSFITASLTAKESLPGLEETLKEKEKEIDSRLLEMNELLEKNKSRLPALNQKIADATLLSNDMKTLLDDDRKTLAKLRFDLTKVKELAAKKTALEVAKSQHESVTRQMEENAAKGKELKIKWENRKSDLDGSIKDAQASLTEIKIDDDIDLRISSSKGSIESIDLQLSEAETSLNSIRANIMKFESDLSARAEIEKDIETANKEKARLQQDISDWTYLRNACGKNGLQAMEIDGAAPIITSFSNDLLTQAFGPLFTVKFRTINEEGKECLDIIVISDDGEEVNLENLSGGQKVWILMALRLAMTLLSKEKSGRNFETFYADELDGALDPDNALNFVNMYRSFMKAGGFKDGYFISHKPSCRSLADNILMFESGKNPAWE